MKQRYRYGFVAMLVTFVGVVLIFSILNTEPSYSQYFRPTQIPELSEVPFPPEGIKPAILEQFKQSTTPLQTLAQRAGEKVTGETGTIPSLTPTTTVETAISPVTGLSGTNLLKVKGLLLEGTALKSTLDSNFVPFYSLVDESIVAFDLSKDQLASVQQFAQNRFTNEFKSTLSKGAKLRQFFRNSDTIITFEATDDASFFLKKDRAYEFEHGILTFRNNEITEKIATKGKTKAVIDSDNGVLELTLAKNASYSYENVEKPEANFLLENRNPSSLNLAVRKDDKALKLENYIDLYSHKIQLKGTITLKKKLNNAFKPFYESFNQNNKATIELDADNSIVASLFLNAQGSTGIVANIYTSRYKIIEKKVNEYKRYVAFHDESPVIKKYYSSLDSSRVVTIDERGVLRQKNSNTVTAIAKGSSGYQECSILLKRFISYEDDSFLEKC